MSAPYDTPVTVSQASTATVVVQNQHWGNPAFADPAAGDYHIGPGSAALDAGVRSDVDHQPRPYQAPDLAAGVLSAAGLAPGVAVKGLAAEVLPLNPTSPP